MDLAIAVRGWLREDPFRIVLRERFRKKRALLRIAVGRRASYCEELIGGLSPRDFRMKLGAILQGRCTFAWSVPPRAAAVGPGGEEGRGGTVRDERGEQ